MGIYILKRLFHTLFVFLGITIIVFVLLHLSGDPVKLMLPVDSTPQMVEETREKLGLNDPFYIQYLHFLGRVIKLDFGMSLSGNVPCMQLIKERFPKTVLLASAGFIIALVIAVPAGILSALKRNSIFDFIISIGVLIGQATPLYWLAIVFVLVFAVKLGWFPSGGFGYTKHLVMPAVVLAVFSTARIARMSRSAMLEILQQDFIRTAKSQGIKQVLVNFKFALKNAAIPIITLVGMEYSVLLEGSIVTETIFSWPGMGRLIIYSVYDRDYPVVQAGVLFFTAIIVCANLAVDILYHYLDPRIKYGKLTK